MAFDAGWPCTLYEYCRMMKTIGLRYESVAWAVVSHMHMDHAGLLSEFLNSGIECFVFGDQFETIDGMERIILKNKEYQSYKKIDKEKVNRISIESFNEVCKQIEVHGEAVKTPGHSRDSITFISKNYEALIGDLHPKSQIMADDSESLASWALIESRGAKRFFPSHAEVFEL